MLFSSSTLFSLRLSALFFCCKPHPFRGANFWQFINDRCYTIIFETYKSASFLPSILYSNQNLLYSTQAVIIDEIGCQLFSLAFECSMVFNFNHIRCHRSLVDATTCWICRQFYFITNIYISKIQ